AGLADRPSTPGSCPHRTADAIEDLVVALRKQYPHDGPKKLRGQLQTLHPDIDVPATSTIGDILKRKGLVRPRRARLRVPPSSSPLGAAVEPKHGPVQMHFERSFREFGLPKKIRTDNGPPFASKALGGLSRLQVWWIQLGITPERIEPGHPEQNGRHERMHRTLKEQTASPPHATLADQQRAFDRFRHDYNDRRPHEALGQKPPASCYEPSLRAMPDRPRAPEYAEDFVVRRVSNEGRFTWKGQILHAGRPLENQPLGLRQVDDDEWELF